MTRRTTQRDLAGAWNRLTLHNDPWMLALLVALLLWGGWVAYRWRDCRRRGGVPIPVWVVVECAAKVSK